MGTCCSSTSKKDARLNNIATKQAIKNTTPGNKSASKEFLDNHQYTKIGVLRYEKIFGKNFISTGGIKTTTKFVSKFNLQEGQNVLDVGCGIGGSAFYMASKYKVNVLGIDLSDNMLNIANERLITEKENFDKNITVKFELCDATKRKFQENSFDVIYSRDCILHIFDKLSLFSNFFKWLKPGGVLFITDYCCGDRPHSDAFNEYLLDRKYHLKTPNEYGEIIEKAGFINVISKDETKQFVSVLNDELNKFERIKDEFVNEYTEKDYHYIVSGWKSKVVRCNDGDQKWGSFIGYKPK
eukprot:978750_1